MKTLLLILLFSDQLRTIPKTTEEWYKTEVFWVIFTGTIIAILTYFLLKVAKRTDKNIEKIEGKVNFGKPLADSNGYINTRTNTNTNINNIPIIINSPMLAQITNSDAGVSLDKRNKSQIRILFIDDNYKDFQMVNILKTYGYENTKALKDVKDLDITSLKEADIVFVDINGVGVTLFPQDQGLGLAPAIKRKYPNKKVIIYSAESNGDRFHKALKEVDSFLYKNAEPFQFVDLIDTLVKSH